MTDLAELREKIANLPIYDDFGDAPRVSEQQRRLRDEAVALIDEYAAGTRVTGDAGLREAAQAYLDNDGSGGRYDARLMIEARERLRAALATGDDA